MKLRWFDAAVLEREPLHLFADMPALLALMHRIGNDLNMLLLQWVRATTYKRTAVLVNAVSHFMDLSNNATGKYIEMLTYAAEIEAATEEENMQPLSAEESVKLQHFAEHYPKCIAFFHHQDVFNDLLYKIDKYCERLISLPTLEKFLKTEPLSLAQQEEVIDWLIDFHQGLIAYNNSLQQSSEQTMVGFDASIKKSYQKGVMSYEAYNGLHEGVWLNVNIQDLVDDWLTFLSELYKKKRELQQTLVWASCEEHWKMHTT